MAQMRTNHIPKLTNGGLSYADVCLIEQCKKERARIRLEMAMLTQFDRRQHADQLRQMKREVAELSDKKLAEKFECSLAAVRFVGVEE